MPVIKITAADVKRVEVIEAKWYGAQITKIHDPKPDSKSNGILIDYDFTIDGTGGKEIRYQFWKGPSESQGWIGIGGGGMIELVESINDKKLEVKEGEPFSFNTDDHLMKKIDVLLYVDNYNGRLSNKIKNFLPYGKGTTQVLPF